MRYTRLVIRTNASPVLVTGATGRVGRLVVDELLRAGVSVRAMTRQPAKAGLPATVDVVAGDFAEPGSLVTALDGVSSIFLVWTAGPASAAAVIDRLASPRRRVVCLSSPHTVPHPFFQQPNPMARMHAELERLLNAAGLAVTFIRPGMFASNVVHWWAPAIRGGAAVRWPYAAAETAPIDERDIAAVVARALIDEADDARDYVLTGPESLSQAEQVGRIGSALGRQIAFEELSPDEFRRETATWPSAVVEMLLNAWSSTLGRPAYVTSTVADVLGRPARTFSEWAVEHADLFRS